MSIFFGNIKQNKKVIQEEFLTGVVPTYITNDGGSLANGTVAASTLPDNKLTATVNAGASTRFVGETSFTMDSSKYKRVTLEINDIKHATPSKFTNMMGFKIDATNYIWLEFKDDGTSAHVKTVRALVSKAGVVTTSFLAKNIALNEPFDIKIDWDIVNKTVDFILEGSLIRLQGDTILPSGIFKTTFYDIRNTETTTTKSVSFSKYVLTLQ